MEIQPTLVSNRPSQAALARCMFSDYQNDRTLAKGLSHHIGFYKLFDLSSSLWAFGLSRAREILPNPKSINQAKATLVKLSPRASRNQYSQSIPQATVIGPHFSGKSPEPTTPSPIHSNPHPDHLPTDWHHKQLSTQEAGKTTTLSPNISWDPVWDLCSPYSAHVGLESSYRLSSSVCMTVAAYTRASQSPSSQTGPIPLLLPLALVGRCSGMT